MLLDERLVKSRRKTAKYVEGHRVFLTVSSKYALNIFKEVYTDEGLTFCSRIMEKHKLVLNKIATHIDNYWRSYNNFSVSSDGVFNHDTDIDVFPDDYEENHCNVFFRELQMKSLDSVGHRYGMALAIIEKLKSLHWSWNNYIFTISREISEKFNFDNIVVRFCESPELAKQNLKDW